MAFIINLLYNHFIHFTFCTYAFKIGLFSYLLFKAVLLSERLRKRAIFHLWFTIHTFRTVYTETRSLELHPGLQFWCMGLSPSYISWQEAGWEMKHPGKEPAKMQGAGWQAVA